MTTLRRGECPGVTHPLPTGDGWLARLVPFAPIALADIAALCKASLAHGNGMLEITQRGNLQVRGLSAASAPRFAALVQTLNLPADTRVPLLTSPLLGLDADEVLDGCALFDELRAAVGRCAAIADIHPKVSVIFDGGGALRLDEVAADVRINLISANSVEIRLAGNALTSWPLGYVAPGDLTSTVIAVLSAIAAHGAHARARDLNGAGPLRHTLASVLHPATPRNLTPARNPIGQHRLKDGLLALGLAFPFGQIHARDLLGLARRADHEGASALRPTAGKVCLVVGLTEVALPRFRAFAASSNLITDAADPRRYVTCCAGAPACSAASVSTRDWAPRITQAAHHLLDGSIHMHLSGCAKGCGQPSAAALGFVGPHGVLVQDQAAGLTTGTASVEQFANGIAHLDTLSRARFLGENSADLLARMGAVNVLATLGAQA
jgi:precorrin-3B synthase